MRQQLSPISRSGGRSFSSDIKTPRRGALAPEVHFHLGPVSIGFCGGLRVSDAVIFVGCGFSRNINAPNPERLQPLKCELIAPESTPAHTAKSSAAAGPDEGRAGATRAFEETRIQP
jgi:hypothetical protein